MDRPQLGGASKDSSMTVSRNVHKQCSKNPKLQLALILKIDYVLANHCLKILDFSISSHCFHKGLAAAELNWV